MTSPTQASETTVKPWILDNGMTVLLQPSRRAKTAAIYLGVTTGSAGEGQWLGSGLSHFVEHMFFKGTANHSLGELENRIRRMGGVMNAYTSYDVTVFYSTFLSKHTPEAVELFHDAAFHPLLDPAELEKEREVILSEMRMGEDELTRKAMMELWAAAFTRHPYRHPIIGYRDLFIQTKREDLLNFWKMHYQPNRMTLSIVGNFDLEEIQKKILDTFGTEKRGTPPTEASPPEPPQLSKRTRSLVRPAQHTRIFWGFRGVPITHPDAPALDLLARVLGDGASSRLHQRLREELRCVWETEAFNSTYKEDGLFVVEAVVDATRVDEVKSRLWEELHRVATDIGPDEMERARRQALAENYARFESHSSLAHDLVVYQIYTGDAEYSRRYLEVLSKLTRDDVESVARRYLTETALTEVTLWPSSQPPAPTAVIGEATDPITEIHKQVLPQGVRLLMREDKTVPLVYLHWIHSGGVLQETEQNNGVTSLMAGLLTRGTVRKSQKEIAELVASWGGELSASSGLNTFAVSMSVLAPHTKEAFALLEEIITEPAFRPEEFEKAKEEQRESVLAEWEDVYAYAGRKTSETLFEKHPYRMDPLGTPESVARLQLDDVRKHYRKILNPHQAVLSAFGDIRESEILAEAKHLSAKLGTVPAVPMNHHEQEPLNKVRVTMGNLPREQAVAMLAFRSVSVSDPRRFGLQILNTILNGSAGRLYKHVRGDHGLAYVVGSELQLGIDPGSFVLYAGTEPAAASKVMELMVDETRRIRTEGVTNDELEAAKIQLIGDFERALEHNASLIRIAAGYELLGPGLEGLARYQELIERVTAEEIRKLANELMDPERSARVLITPKA